MASSAREIQLNELRDTISQLKERKGVRPPYKFLTEKSKAVERFRVKTSQIALVNIFWTRFYKKLVSGIIKNNTYFDDIFDIASGIARQAHADGMNS